MNIVIDSCRNIPKNYVSCERLSHIKFSKQINGTFARVRKGINSLKIPPVPCRLNSITSRSCGCDVQSWAQTLKDIRAVHQLRKNLSYSGYPFSRLIKNQIGDGILNSAIAGLAVVAATADPLLAGILVWGTRTVEYGISVVWNQHMSSQRRLARLAAEGCEVDNKLLCKWKAAKELVSSCKYDFIAGAATLTGIVVAFVGGPISAIIGLGALIAVCQTMSRFKEMSWGALRYIVNPNDQLQKEIVNLQEPMSAYEMALNIGAMTLAYVVAFSAITAFYVFVPEVALPASIGLGLIGMGMMLTAKYRFREEEHQAKKELEAERIWRQSYDALNEKYQRYREKKNHIDHDETISRLQKVLEKMKKCASSEVSELTRDEIELKIGDLMKESSNSLEGYLSKGHRYEIVSLRDWKLEELTNVYRASEKAEEVNRKKIHEWLELQDILYASLSINK